MGLYDRDYTKNDFDYKPGRMPRMRMGLPRITYVVKVLLIINIAVFFLGLIIPPLGRVMYAYGQLDPSSIGRAAQLWRLVTYQFLHSPASIWHILLNMIGLYFLGSALENHWGSRRFLYFFLGCGVAGGLFYMLLVGVGFLEPLPMIGASGGVLGLLAACAILFPQFVVFILFFPVPIRLVAIVAPLIYIFFVITQGENAGGHAAHLAGMAAGAGYVWSENWRASLRMRYQSKAWQKNLADEQNLQEEVDRILQKVHDNGIQSLTRKEKKTLKKATEEEQRRIRGSL